MKKIITKHHSRIYRRKTRFKFWMLRPKERLYNRVWTFHLYDEDFFPSILHGHSEKYVLNAFDGDVYSKQNHALVGHAKKKELQSLWANSDFYEFAIAHIMWYRETFPKVPAEVPSWIYKRNNYIVARNKQSNTEISFSIKIVFDDKR